MRTLTVRLPESLVTEIERESQVRRVSKSDVVRGRLQQSGCALKAAASMKDTIGDILDGSWSAEVPAGPPRFRSPHKQGLAEVIRAKKLHR